MCLYKALISGEGLQDHWSSGYLIFEKIMQNEEKIKIKFCIGTFIFILIFRKIG